MNRKIGSNHLCKNFWFPKGITSLLEVPRHHSVVQPFQVHVTGGEVGAISSHCLLPHHTAAHLGGRSRLGKSSPRMDHILAQVVIFGIMFGVLVLEQKHMVRTMEYSDPFLSKREWQWDCLHESVRIDMAGRRILGKLFSEKYCGTDQVEITPHAADSGSKKKLIDINHFD